MKFPGSCPVRFCPPVPILPGLRIFVACLLMLGSATQLFAQAPATATPVRARLVTPTPEGLEAPKPSPSPNATPTPLPAVRLRALDTAGNVNIRALPSLDSDILGTLGPGVQYQALRRYYRWFEFRYDLARTGRAWVYGDLVEIIGDRSKIVIIDNPSDITAPVAAQPQDSAEAADRSIAISTLQADSVAAVELAQATNLPTFTPPAATPVSFAEHPEFQPSDQPPWMDLPPIAPIALLGALGILGFLINLLRG